MMSMIAIVGSSAPQPNRSGVAARPETESAARNGAPGAILRDTSTSRGDGAAGASAETTRAAPEVRRIPPAEASRNANAAAPARGGGDGGDAATIAREARDEVDAALAPDPREARARMLEKVAQDRLLAKEIMSRIPVPVEALPRLTADAQRSTEERAPIGTGRSVLA